MINRKYNRFFFLQVFVCGTFTLFSQYAWPVEYHIDQLVKRVPAGNHPELQSVVKELTTLGEEGVREICSRLKDVSEQDDHRERMLLASLVRAASKDQKDQWIERSLLHAIDLLDNKSVKLFLLQTLIPVATAQSVHALSPLLQDPDYCQAVIRLYSYLPSHNYQEVLLTNINSGIPCQIEAIKCISYSTSKEVKSMMEDMRSHPESAIRKMAESYLASHGNPLDWKQVKSHYPIQDQVAFLDNLYKKGHIQPANKVAKYILKKPGPVHQKKATLTVISKHLEADAFPTFKKMVKSGPQELAAHAIRLGGKWPGKNVTRAWIELLPEATQESKVQIIKMLGRRRDPLAGPVIKKYLYSPQPLPAIAALEAAGELDDFGALEGMSHLLRSQNSPLMQLNLNNYLRRKMDESSLHKLWDSFNEYPVENQVMLLNLAGSHKMFGLHKRIKKILDQGDPKLEHSAWKAWLETLDPIYKDQVLAQLGKGNPERDRFRQAWLARYYTKHKSSVNAILGAVERDNWVSIYELLSKLGGIHAANSLAHIALSKGRQEVDSAFHILSKWPDGWAVDGLCKIMSKYPEFKGEGINQCLRYLRYSNWNNQQRRLKLEKLMNLANSTDQKLLIIQQWASLRGDLTAILILDKWMNEEELQTDAAIAVAKIADPGKDQLIYPISCRNLRHVLARSEVVLKSAGEDELFRRVVELQQSYQKNDFVSLFNGKDLSGWKGLVGNPISRDTMHPDTLSMKQKLADIKMRKNWSVKDGSIVFSGHGQNLLTEKEYRDFELLLDWKITKDGDSGIYLRGTPQIQIWDTSRVNSKVGSGGLYNNKIGRSTPLRVADNPVGDWNHFKIRMIDDKVSVWLNGKLIVDEVTLENYWDRSLPIFREGYIELQAHGTDLAFRHLFLRELDETVYRLTDEEIEAGFKSLFNGKNLDGWVGNKTDYVVENKQMVIYPHRGGSGNLFTEREYDNFTFRFEFQLTPGANNGLGIHTALTGNAAYQGKEIQILDNTAEVYKNLKPYQYHGSVYGVIPAKRGFLRPVGEWNEEEVTVKGSHIQVKLNGTTIVNGDYLMASKFGTMDGHNHPGLQKMIGHIGFLGHGSVVRFRNIRIQEH